MSFATHVTAEPIAWGKGRSSRSIPEETASAIVVNGSTLAVMMATPADLEAFGLGFALSEGVIESIDEVERLDVIDHALGLEVRLWVTEPRARALAARRRRMAGPTGCGLCGIESLEEAMRGIQPISNQLALTPDQVMAALASLRPAQSLNAQTHAVHAAALWHPEQGLLAICEDVGRHNALDKLIGRSAQLGLATQECALLLTSRVSVEMVQKAAVLGAPTIIAVSAPTNIAVSLCHQAGLTLIGVARDDGYEVFA